MERNDILQVLIENEQGLTAQAVRAEMRDRYGVGGKVKSFLESLMSEGLVTAGLDEDGHRLYIPDVRECSRALDAASSARRGECFFD